MSPEGRSDRRRAAAGLLLAIVAGACAGPASNEAGAPPASRARQVASVAVVVDNNGLWAATDGGRQLLADDGKYYEARVSPDGSLIAAEIALFSDLQIVRVFRRSRGSESWEPAADVTAAVWQAAAEAHDLALEDVSNARTRFVAWSGDGAALELEVSGRLPDGREVRHSEIVRLDRPAAG